MIKRGIISMATILKAGTNGFNTGHTSPHGPGPHALPSALNGAGLVRGKRLTLAVDAIAPEPGSLVFLLAERLACGNDELNPTVFTAIDACTSLEVARIYMTWTFASAVDFLLFAAELFPFQIRRVRTLASGPFYRPTIPEGNHEFARIAQERGISHSLITDAAEDELYQAASKFAFHGMFDGRMDRESELRILKALADFLFFHNNQRSLPSLGGKTPVQKLHSFAGYDRLRYFDPFVSPTMLTRRSPHKA
jgi:hypothetical protein